MMWWVGAILSVAGYIITRRLTADVEPREWRNQ